MTTATSEQRAAAESVSVEQKSGQITPSARAQLDALLDQMDDLDCALMLDFVTTYTATALED